jgi:hypothetical protein
VTCGELKHKFIHIGRHSKRAVRWRNIRITLAGWSKRIPSRKFWRIDRNPNFESWFLPKNRAMKPKNASFLAVVAPSQADFSVMPLLLLSEYIYSFHASALP